MQRKHEFCLVKGCGAASHGKQYCDKHMTATQRRKMSSAQNALIRSDCCNAKCVTGEVHENGEQYCTKCKEACCWKAAA